MEDIENLKNEMKVTNENIAFHTIKELKRLNDCFIALSTSLEVRLDKKVDKSTSKWQWLLIFGSFGFTLFVLGTILTLHLKV